MGCTCCTGVGNSLDCQKGVVEQIKGRVALCLQKLHSEEGTPHCATGSKPSQWGT